MGKSTMHAAIPTTSQSARDPVALARHLEVAKRYLIFR